MPLVIFEGASGVGKTTAALAYSKRSGAPIHRPFRRGVEGHETGVWHNDLALIPMQFNTWQEDIVIADLLGSTANHNLILDRSLISGLVWANDMWDGKPPLALAGVDAMPDLSYGAKAALRYWCHCMAEANATLVLMALSEYERQARGGRTGAWEPKAFDMVVNRIPPGVLRVVRISGHSCVEQVVDRVLMNAHDGV